MDWIRPQIEQDLLEVGFESKQTQENGIRQEKCNIRKPVVCRGFRKAITIDREQRRGNQAEYNCRVYRPTSSASIACEQRSRKKHLGNIGLLRNLWVDVRFPNPLTSDKKRKSEENKK
ncbi:MAG: hypothetical protein NTV29_10800 [Planctomycetota bacterium]|nr:hypothetical protein [Planctomycetota bacterium]